VFKNRLYDLKAYRKDREELRDAALKNPLYLEEVFALAFAVSDKNHHKACWILELVCEEKLELILPYLDRFCEVLPLYENQSALRPMSKIAMLLTQQYPERFSENQIQKIIETSFDRLISRTKVAAKVYAMDVLFELGKHHKWIHPELKQIITQDYISHSPGYKAHTRMLLKKMN